MVLQIRIGPGKFEAHNRKFTHPFDGFSKLHSFKIGEDSKTRIRFSSRFLETDYYKESELNHNDHPIFYFGDVEPALTTFQTISALHHGCDNPAVNVLHFGSETYAMGDLWEGYRFDKATLNNATRVRPEVDLPGFYKYFEIMSSAHPLPEYGTGSMITTGNIDSPVPGLSSMINLLRMDEFDKRKIIATIPVDRAPYMHSFGLTKNYAILFADPVYIDVFTVLRYATVTKALEFHADQNTTVYVVSLKDGEIVQTSTTPGLFHAHHINAYELGNEIYIDVVTYPNMDIFLDVKANNMENVDQLSDIFPELITYVIDIEHGNMRQLPNHPGNAVSSTMDFPAINEHYRFSKNCFTFGSINKADGIDFGTMGLVKRDSCRNKDIVWFKEGHYPNEPIFVPNPEGITEDDGILLSTVLDEHQDKSYMLLLDAKTMKTLSVTYAPIRIPFTVHGTFIAS